MLDLSRACCAVVPYMLCACNVSKGDRRHPWLNISGWQMYALATELEPVPRPHHVNTKLVSIPSSSSTAI